MKILKAKVSINRWNGSTNYHYPWAWLSNKEKIPAILYPSNRNDEIIENGQLYQIVYPIVPDDVATELLKDSNFSLPTRPEIESYANKHYPIKDSITDDKKILTILAKVARKESLTLEDEKALDPNSPEKGINKSRSWLEVCTDYNVTNI